ncbi:MAG: aminotransferase class V-fold PLP-dependent enzyme, partial [Actinobacteria bacterium]|nr:aminotransferase class V-fold PLP-dependent enzyme [Actinomycetota bacterium]
VLDADILVMSPYKVFGPHLGVLYGRAEVLRSLRPYKVRPASDDIPWAFETGTMNHEGMAGFTAAVNYLAGLGWEFGNPKADSRRAAVVAGMKAIREHETELTSVFLEGLAKIPRARLYGRPVVEDRTPTFAVTIEGRHSREVSEALGDRGISTWDGHYYAIALMERLGLEPGGGAVRIGFCHYNTVEEVGRVLDALGSLTRGGL